METRCSITGNIVQEHEGVSWQQIHPSIQDFLKTVHQNWDDNSFISYVALNELMRNYITGRAEEEQVIQLQLDNKLKTEYTEEKALQRLGLGIEAPPTWGERWADRIAGFGGSWKFIGIFITIMIVWMVANAVFLHSKAFDPYPFILLNLVLSCLAALQAPIIMMSQNRQEDKDRAHAEYDFRVNVKAEAEIQSLHEKVDHLLLHQQRNVDELFKLQLDMMQMMQQRIEMLTKAAQGKPEK